MKTVSKHTACPEEEFAQQLEELSCILIGSVAKGCVKSILKNTTTHITHFMA